MNVNVIDNIKKSKKLWWSAIILFAISLILFRYQILDCISYIMLFFVDLIHLDIILDLFPSMVGVRGLLLLMPVFVLFFGMSYYNTNIKYIKPYIGYKKLLSLLENEKFKKSNAFLNEEFAYSKNWFWLDNVLIPIFMIENIKIRDGAKLKVCLELKDGQKYVYSPSTQNKIILDGAKTLEKILNKSKEDMDEVFELTYPNKTFKIINIVGLICSICSLLGFIFAKNLALGVLDQDILNIISYISMGIAIISFIVGIIIRLKRKWTKVTKWFVGISIFTILFFVCYWICSIYIYNQTGIEFF